MVALLLVAPVNGVMAVQEQSREPVMVIAGQPWRIEYARTRLGKDHVCAEFHLVAGRGHRPGLILTTSGLGSATVAHIPHEGPIPCEDPAPVERLALQVDVAAEQPQRFRVRIPLGPLPRSGPDVEGRILVFRDSVTFADASLLLTPPRPLLVTSAFLWFIGLAIPGLLTTWLAYSGHKRKQRYDAAQAKEEAFRRFRRDKWDELEGSFRDFLPNAVLGHTEHRAFARSLHDELRRHGAFDSMPDELHKRLLDEMRTGTSVTIGEALGAAFPEWKEHIAATLCEPVAAGGG